MQSQSQNFNLETETNTYLGKTMVSPSAGKNLKMIVVLSAGCAALASIFDAGNVHSTQFANTTQSVGQTNFQNSEDFQLEQCPQGTLSHPAVHSTLEVKWSKATTPLDNNAVLTQDEITHPVTNNTPAASPEVLQLGDTGEAVRGLQEQLNARGSNLEVDGIFGPKTLSAVSCFQALAGLEENGVVDSETARLIVFSDPAVGMLNITEKNTESHENSLGQLRLVSDDGSQISEEASPNSAENADGSESLPSRDADETRSEEDNNLEDTEEESADNADAEDKSEDSNGSSDSDTDEDESLPSRNSGADESQSDNTENDVGESEASPPRKIDAEGKSSITVLLQTISEEKAAAQLIGEVLDPGRGKEPRARREAVLALGEMAMSDKDARAAVIEAVNDDDEMVRETAKQVLLTMGDRDSEETPDRADAAIIMWSLLGNEGTVPTLNAIAQDTDKDAEARIAAIEILGRKGIVDGVPTLIEVSTTEDDQTVKEAAQKALQEFNGDRGREELVNILLEKIDGIEAAEDTVSAADIQQMKQLSTLIQRLTTEEA